MAGGPPGSADALGPLLTGTPQALEAHLEGSGIEVLALRPGETAA